MNTNDAVACKKKHANIFPEENLMVTLAHLSESIEFSSYLVGRLFL